MSSEPTFDKKSESELTFYVECVKIGRKGILFQKNRQQNVPEFVFSEQKERGQKVVLDLAYDGMARWQSDEGKLASL